MGKADVDEIMTLYTDVDVIVNVNAPQLPFGGCEDVSEVLGFALEPAKA